MGNVIAEFTKASFSHTSWQPRIIDSIERAATHKSATWIFTRAEASVRNESLIISREKFKYSNGVSRTVLGAYAGSYAISALNSRHARIKAKTNLWHTPQNISACNIEWYRQYVVLNGQRDGVLDNHWDPKHGSSITLGVLLAQERVNASRDMNNNDAEWPPGKASEIFNGTSDRGNTVVRSVCMGYCVTVRVESFVFWTPNHVLSS
jgi:hypothetical protein